MKDRVIVIFPKFVNADVIHNFRVRFDPLAEWLPPHLTLVFPFEVELSTEELRQHLVAVANRNSVFELRLQGITGSEGEYLFLNVKQGNDELIALHDQLYTGPLQPHLRRDLTFLPHLTVGRVTTPDTFSQALDAAAEVRDTFETVVKEISVYSIHPDGTRVIELAQSLVG